MHTIKTETRLRLRRILPSLALASAVLALGYAHWPQYGGFSPLLRLILA